MLGLYLFSPVEAQATLAPPPFRAEPACGRGGNGGRGDPFLSFAGRGHVGLFASRIILSPFRCAAPGPKQCLGRRWPGAE
jgi:hypothetical protein